MCGSATGCDVGPRSARWKRAIDYYQPLRVPHEGGHSARGESDHLSNQEAAKQIQHYYMPESHEVATPGMPMVANKQYDPTNSGAGALEQTTPPGSHAAGGVNMASGPPSSTSPARASKMRLDELQDEMRAVRTRLMEIEGAQFAASLQAVTKEHVSELSERVQKIEDSVPRLVKEFHDTMGHVDESMRKLAADLSQKHEESVEQLRHEMTEKLGKKVVPLRTIPAGVFDGVDEDEGLGEDNESVTPSNAPASNRLNLIFFTTKEIEARSCDMSREKIDSKIPELKEDLEQKHTRVLELLNCPEKEYRERIVAKDAEGDLDREADAFVRRACRACISADGDHAMVFREEEKELRKMDVAESRLGRMLLERMQDFGTLTASDDIRKHKKYLEEAVYLKVGLSKIQAKAAMMRLRSDYNLLPSRERAAVDISRKLLAKVPPELTHDASRNFAEKLEDEMDEAEADEKTPRSFTNLMNVIATRLDGVKDGSTTLVLTKQGVAHCHNCDKKECDGIEKCRVRCKTVSWLKCCPCCRGEQCVIAMEKLPEREKIKGRRRRDGQGREYCRTEQYKKYEKAHKEHHGERKTAAAASGEGTGGNAVGAASVRSEVPQDEERPLVFFVSTRAVAADESDDDSDASSADESEEEEVESLESLRGRWECSVLGSEMSSSEDETERPRSLDSRQERREGWRRVAAVMHLQHYARGMLARRAAARIKIAVCLPVASDQAQMLSAAALRTCPPQDLGDGTIKVRFLLDTGSDANLVLVSQEMARYASIVKPGATGVDGLGGAASTGMNLGFHAAMPGAPSEPFEMSALELQDGKGLQVAIISHALLHDLTGGVIRYEPEMRVEMRDAGEQSRVMREGKHYFVDLILASRREQVVKAAGSPTVLAVTQQEPAAAAARVRVDDPALLWAVRMGVDAETLPKLSSAVDGLDIKKVSRESAVVINNDAALRRSRHKERPRMSSVPPKMREDVLPGHTWHYDKWFAMTPCTITKDTGVMHAFCITSSVVVMRSLKVENLSALVKFANDIKRAEQARGHVMRVFKIDAVPFMGSPEARDSFEQQTGLVLARAAGGEHQGLSEAAMNPLTRRTEAAMLRARSAVPPVPEGMMIKCRMYQGQIWNMSLKEGGEGRTRLQIHLGTAVSVREMVPFIFWTQVSVKAIKPEIKKGHMTETQSSRDRTARVIGHERQVDGTGRHQLYTCDTKEVITRHAKDCDALDEHVLLRAALAGGSAVTDAEVQCTVEDLPKLVVLPTPEPKPPPAPKSVIKYKMPHEDVPVVGDKLEVLWQDEKGAGHRYWDAEVVTVKTDDDGVTTHGLRYVDWQDKTPFCHDLARDAASGLHAWRKKKPEKQRAAPEATAGEKEEQKRYALRERKRLQTLAMIEQIDEAVSNSEKPEATFDACCEFLFGDAAAPHLTSEFEGKADVLGKAMTSLYVAVHDGPGFDLAQPACAAVTLAARTESAEFRLVAGGEMVTFKTPRTDRDVWAAPDSTEWLIEENKAIHESILSLPFNHVVSEEAARAECQKHGDKIGHLTPTRYYKVDPHTKVLKRRKVRHSFDNKRHMNTAAPDVKTRLMQFCTHTMPIGELEANMFWASVEPEDYIFILDWKDGYALGIANRGVRFVFPPKTVPLTDSEGNPGVIALQGAGLWGEAPAGFEFEEARNEDMIFAGWPAIAEVPALFYGGGTDRGIAIIDDLAIKVKNPATAHALHKALCARVAERGGQPLTIEGAPTSWGGMQIWRSPDKRSLGLNMPYHIEESARRWIPEYVEKGVLPEGTPQGPALRKALDALRLVPGTAPLSGEQRDCQRVVGDLRWMLKRVTRIVKPVHHLSCVMQRAPPGTLLVAFAVLACAYDYRMEGHTWSADADEASFVGVLRGTQDARQGTAVKKVDVERRKLTGAPKQMEGGSDTTWARGVNGASDIICLFLTFRGGLVNLDLKKSPIVSGGSSASIEGLGLAKLTDKAVYARIVAEKLGVDMSEPTMLLCDAEAALRGASGESSVVRLKHEMRRLAIVKARVRMKQVGLAHVPDTANAADVFTKWVSLEKFEAMLAYLIGARFRRTGADKVACVMAALAIQTEDAEVFNMLTEPWAWE
jgi:hypothetical protein